MIFGRRGSDGNIRAGEMNSKRAKVAAGKPDIMYYSNRIREQTISFEPSAHQFESRPADTCAMQLWQSHKAFP
jgi:hypothetical protein